MTVRVPPAPRRLYAGGSFFECPRWRDGRWWVSDFQQHRVVAVTPSGDAEEVLRVEAQPSGLGWMPDGSLLVVSMHDRRILRRSVTGEVTVHADLAGTGAGDLNDMVVDGAGRAYVGGIGFQVGVTDPAATDLIRVDPDGTATVVASDLWMPNGTVIAADGGTLIVGESLAGRYTAFTIAADGALTDRRCWARIGPAPPAGPMAEMMAALEFVPDGCALDAEGLIWATDPPRGRCVRVAPGGEIAGEVRVEDGQGIYACMLGGDDGRSLVLCVAPIGARRQGSRAAELRVTEVEVPAAGLP